MWGFSKILGFWIFFLWAGFGTLWVGGPSIGVRKYLSYFNSFDLQEEPVNLSHLNSLDFSRELVRPESTKPNCGGDALLPPPRKITKVIQNCNRLQLFIALNFQSQKRFGDQKLLGPKVRAGPTITSLKRVEDEKVCY